MIFCWKSGYAMCAVRILGEGILSTGKMGGKGAGGT